MGHTYAFTCEKCGYSASVAGGATEGAECAVQTIVCRECRILQDAVTSLLVPLESPSLELAPPFAEVNRRLPLRVPVRREFYTATCVVDVRHTVREWTRPDKCTRCGAFLDRTSAIPFRQWD